MIYRILRALIWIFAFLLILIFNNINHIIIIFISAAIFNSSLIIYGVFNIKSSLFVKTYYRIKKPKTVYLTFDDGPDENITPMILEILSQNNIKAAFFVIGKKACKYPSLLKKIVDQGHDIGIHSYEHNIGYTFFGKNKLIKDIELCKKTIYDICNFETKLYRPPFGFKNPKMYSVLKKAELNCISWDVRGFDNVYKNHSLILKRIIKKTRDGSIILLHDGRISDEKDKKAKVENILLELIDNLKKRGFKFCRIKL